jgi:pimeloyl-ACP methyl ester carboxylesterase
MGLVCHSAGEMARPSILNAWRAGWNRPVVTPEGYRCPTLLLHPDGSPFIPVPIMAELHRLLPHAELNVIGHSRHGLPYSHAKIVCITATRLPGKPAQPADGVRQRLRILHCCPDAS